MFAQHQRHITTRPFCGKRLSGRGALLDCMRDLISDYRAVLQRKQADDATRTLGPIRVLFRCRHDRQLDRYGGPKCLEGPITTNSRNGFREAGILNTSLTTDLIHHDCNLTRLSRLLRILGFHAHDLNLIPSAGVYLFGGQGSRRRLRFTKSGDARVEEIYARHFVWPGKGPFHPPLHEKIAE